MRVADVEINEEREKEDSGDKKKNGKRFPLKRTLWIKSN